MGAALLASAVVLLAFAGVVAAGQPARERPVPHVTHPVERQRPPLINGRPITDPGTVPAFFRF
jgi:hypothetical protein